MKYRPLFRLLLKLLGVYFVINGLLTILPAFSWMFLSPGDMSIYDMWRSGRAGFTKTLLLSMFGPLIKVAVGLYLFFGGKLVAGLAFPRNRAFCSECACPLNSSDSAQCPDCGCVLPSGPVDQSL